MVVAVLPAPAVVVGPVRVVGEPAALLAGAWVVVVVAGVPNVASVTRPPSLVTSAAGSGTRVSPSQPRLSGPYDAFHRLTRNPNRLVATSGSGDGAPIVRSLSSNSFASPAAGARGRPAGSAPSRPSQNAAVDAWSRLCTGGSSTSTR